MMKYFHIVDDGELAQYKIMQYLAKLILDLLRQTEYQLKWHDGIAKFSLQLPQSFEADITSHTILDHVFQNIHNHERQDIVISTR